MKDEKKNEKIKVLLTIWEECIETKSIDNEEEFKDAFGIIRDKWLSVPEEE
jgi:hypothetical protein